MTIRELLKAQKKMLKKKGLLDRELSPASSDWVSENSMLMFLVQEGTPYSETIKIGYKRSQDGIEPIVRHY